MDDVWTKCGHSVAVKTPANVEKGLENIQKYTKIIEYIHKVLVMPLYGLPKGGFPPLVSSYLGITNTFRIYSVLCVYLLTFYSLSQDFGEF